MKTITLVLLLIGTSFAGTAFAQRISKEARRHMYRGEAAIEDSEEKEDLEVALEEDRKLARCAGSPC